MENFEQVLEEKKAKLRLLKRGTIEFAELCTEVFKLAIKNGEAVYGPTHYEFCSGNWCRCSE